MSMQGIDQDGHQILFDEDDDVVQIGAVAFEDWVYRSGLDGLVGRRWDRIPPGWTLDILHSLRAYEDARALSEFLPLDSTRQPG